MADVEREALISFIDRIEAHENEKDEILDDIKGIYAEFKGAGGDPKALKKVIALRKIDKEEREEMQSVIDQYMEISGG